MDGVLDFLRRFEKFSKNTDLLLAAAMMAILTVMMLPLPSILLDLALTVVITFSLAILVISIYTDQALDLSIFPSLLLISTLGRLSLNVASTRLILSEGHAGGDAAGAVIQAFGSFVVGDNYVIGLIVFIILVVINFVVITKGSGRVAEVAARFTLDAMPGKQMSIDADLNAGLISEEEARKRRTEIEQQADFYGAMDGASKFVRGDAIAGIIITLVNVVGGLLIGVLQRGLDLSTAAENYTMLTIGDGLVSQIPALLISTAAGIVVTRSSGTKKNLGSEMTTQLMAKPKALAIVGSILIFLGLVPGMPLFPFMLMGSLTLSIAFITHKFREDNALRKQKEEMELAAQPEKENIESLLPLDLLELEVGYGLINVVESEESGDLLERIVSIRKQFALDLGIVVPSIHIRDNLQLEPGEYRFLIKGNKIGGGTLMPENLLAMDPGNVLKEIRGIPTKEPAFGLDAMWVHKNLKEEAEISGYTVVDLPTVIATHLTEMLRTHSHELMGRQEASALVENFKEIYPKIVEDLVPDILPLGTVVQVLQGLLKEQVSIRDLRTIFETLADEGHKTKQVENLVESCRKALARAITEKLLNEEGMIPVLSLSPYLEETVSNSLLQTEDGIQLVMDPHVAQNMITEIAKMIETNPEIAGQPVLLTSPSIRRHIRRLTERFIPQLQVVSHNELSIDANISSVGTVEVSYAS
ncbi:MAG: flagellar biosynthesis protein FlhA [Bdellovibrionota bacterium]|nr:flagellar biosynthesis protein FlhA [Pseudobdellovibrionaceae bacterium]|tara:strand:+ start:14479 stop:16578 length:2100 start_codon:yes stop_codon:yes gene_type:complete